MEKNLKKLFDEYNSLPKSPQRTELGKMIRDEKKKLIEKKNYVEMVYILQFMGEYEKDRLFLDLLSCYPDSSLFVLAFAETNMHSYLRACDIEKVCLDDEFLREDVELTFDSILYDFLSSHNSEKDLEYVSRLIDGASWLQSYKKIKKKNEG